MEKKKLTEEKPNVSVGYVNGLDCIPVPRALLAGLGFLDVQSKADEGQKRQGQSDQPQEQHRSNDHWVCYLLNIFIESRYYDIFFIFIISDLVVFQSLLSISQF